MSLVEQRREAQRALAQAYREVFSGPKGDLVLRDMARFCRATESTFHPDPRLAAQLDGRREVWLRIQENVQLTDEQLFALKGV